MADYEIFLDVERGTFENEEGYSYFIIAVAADENVYPSTAFTQNQLAAAFNSSTTSPDPNALILIVGDRIRITNLYLQEESGSDGDHYGQATFQSGWVTASSGSTNGSTSNGGSFTAPSTVGAWNTITTAGDKYVRYTGSYEEENFSQNFSQRVLWFDIRTTAVQPDTTITATWPSANVVSPNFTVGVANGSANTIYTVRRNSYDGDIIGVRVGNGSISCDIGYTVAEERDETFYLSGQVAISDGGQNIPVLADSETLTINPLTDLIDAGDVNNPTLSGYGMAVYGELGELQLTLADTIPRFITSIDSSIDNNSSTKVILLPTYVGAKDIAVINTTSSATWDVNRGNPKMQTWAYKSGTVAAPSLTVSRVDTSSGGQDALAFRYEVIIMEGGDV